MTSPYTEQTWVDEVVDDAGVVVTPSDTPQSAARFQHIESGIKAQSNRLDLAEPAIDAVEAEIAAAETQIAALNLNMVNVRAFGAVADGTTDDTDAIADAIDQAAAIAAISGRQVVVQLMAGTHLVTPYSIPANTSFIAGIQLPSNVHLRGAGRGATIVKLAGQIPVAGHIIHNTGLGGGDHDITISDLTVDGNGVDQAQLSQGINLIRARDISIFQVTVTNVYGTAAFPPGETFHYNLVNCARANITDCRALGTAGTQGSGFGDNNSTDVIYTGCVAQSMSAGMGFASWHGGNISYANCRAHQCGANGFNVEYGINVVYTACIAGGNASDNAGGYFYANSAPLGNSGSGFVINSTQKAVLVGCISRRNATGCSVVRTSDTDQCSAQFIGGYFDSNTVGLYFGDAYCGTHCDVAGATYVADNSHVNWSIQGSGAPGEFALTSSAPDPGGVPGDDSGVEITNPYPFPCMVYLRGGSATTAAISGGIVGETRAVLVPRGGRVTFSWTGTAYRAWFRA